MFSPTVLKLLIYWILASPESFLGTQKEMRLACANFLLRDQKNLYFLYKQVEKVNSISPSTFDNENFVELAWQHLAPSWNQPVFAYKESLGNDMAMASKIRHIEASYSISLKPEPERRCYQKVICATALLATEADDHLFLRRFIAGYLHLPNPHLYMSDVWEILNAGSWEGEKVESPIAYVGKATVRKHDPKQNDHNRRYDIPKKPRKKRELFQGKNGEILLSRMFSLYEEKDGISHDGRRLLIHETLYEKISPYGKLLDARLSDSQDHLLELLNLSLILERATQKVGLSPNASLILNFRVIHVDGVSRSMLPQLTGLTVQQVNTAEKELSRKRNRLQTVLTRMIPSLSGDRIVTTTNESGRRFS